MGFILVTSRVPLHNAESLGQAFIGKKVPEVADYIKPNEKMVDAMISISTRYAGYRIVEGFKFIIEPLIEIQDALPMLGLGKK